MAEFDPIEILTQQKQELQRNHHENYQRIKELQNENKNVLEPAIEELDKAISTLVTAKNKR